MPAPTGSFEFETFGVAKAHVAAYGTYPPTWYQVPITQEGTLKIAVSKAEVLDGMGNLDYVWRHSPKCTVNLKAGKQSMRILELVSGNTVSSASGVERIYFGTDGEFSPPLVMLSLIAVATDPAAASPTRVYQQVFLYKCQVKFPDLDFAAAKVGEVTIDFDAYKSTKDEAGNTIPAAFGQLKSGSTTPPL